MRMDGASFVSLDVATAKATTAAAVGAPTEALESAIDAGKTSLLSSVSTIGRTSANVRVAKDY
jgi:uncharacterized protein GlcG (DUF336 family)